VDGAEQLRKKTEVGAGELEAEGVREMEGVLLEVVETVGEGVGVEDRDLVVEAETVEVKLTVGEFEGVAELGQVTERTVALLAQSSVEHNVAETKVNLGSIKEEPPPPPPPRTKPPPK
jgi:hypothetical protein